MNCLPILSIIFYAISIASNITGQKLIAFNGSVIVISIGTIIYPLTYLTGVIITELYGFKQTKIIIFTSCVCNIFIALFFYLWVQVNIGVKSSVRFPLKSISYNSPVTIDIFEGN